jgi:3-oxoacyl-[acyl-carrier protein] reductase
MPGRIEGKVAIITGGGSGFGFGIAEKFLEEGAKCVIIDIVEGQAGKLASSKSGCRFLKGDISSRAVWEEGLALALKDFGRLDVVVNNAGILIVKVLWNREG